MEHQKSACVTDPRTTAALLTEGGPGTAFLSRLRLAHPELGASSVRTAALLTAICWAPLLVLSLLGGFAIRDAKIPFLYDIGTQVRLLVAVPVLVLAEIPIGRGLREAAGRFLSTHLVREKELTRFNQIFVDALKRRDSRLAEIILVILVYGGSSLIILVAPFESGSTWIRPGTYKGLSLAGYWYALVALPAFQFLMLRWIYRLGIWTEALWKISKLDLALTPTHPDRAGGLRFLGQAMPPFGLVLFALSSVASATIASRIFFQGETLEEYQWSYLAFFLVLVAIFTVPLLTFAPKLMALKERGLHQYGELASTYNQAFHSKWVESLGATEDRLLGTGDIQSQAALENSFRVVNEIKPIPLGLGDFLGMVAPGLVPALPLILTIMPASAVLKAVMRLAATAG